MLTQSISERFTSYFTEQGHALLPSSPLTHPDPTLLFVNAGMVQFKPYFTGSEPPLHSRVTTVQKCLRTVSIEKVGGTSRHGTYFNMCGNFSFGDYFKDESIRMCWDFLTGPEDEGKLGMDPQRLWITVLEGDHDTRDLWLTLTDVLPGQVQERGREHNYWSMGVPGPGGPCTEVYYDRGPRFGEEGGPVKNEERYLEIWNLVFMEELLSETRSRHEVTVGGVLSMRCVDTGMGLERVSCVLQDRDSILETDLVLPILLEIERLTGRQRSESPETRRSLLLITDHLRSSLMLMSDGVRPGNSGQSYGLRRLLRRSVRELSRLTEVEDLVQPILEVCLQQESQLHPEILHNHNSSLEIGRREEHLFRGVLRRGLRVLESEMSKSRKRGFDEVPGEVGFRLTSTLGFPAELTREVCEERGFKFGEEEYEQLWEEHRRKSRG